MSPRKRVAADEHVELADLPVRGADIPAEKSQTEQRREDELESLLSGLGSDTQLVVYHVIDGKTAYAGSMSGEGFSLDALLDTFGGGEKSIVIMQGGRRIEKIRVPLDPSIPPTSPRQKAIERQAAQNGGGSSGRPGGAPSLGDLGGFLAAVGQSQASMMQTMVAMMANNANQSNTMVTALISMMGAKRDVDPLDMLTRAMELTKAQGGNGMHFDVFEKGLNLGKLLTNGGDDGETALIKTGIETAGRIAEAIAVGRGQPRGAENGSGSTGEAGDSRDSRPRVGADLSRVSHGDGARPAGRNGDDLAPLVHGRVGSESGAVTVVEPSPDAGGRIAGSIAPVEHSGMSAAEARQFAHAAFASARPWVRAVGPYRDQLELAARFMAPQTAAFEIVRRIDDDQFSDLMEDIEDDAAPGFTGRLRAIFPGLAVSDEWLEEMVAHLIQQAEPVDVSTTGTDVAPEAAP